MHLSFGKVPPDIGTTHPVSGGSGDEVELWPSAYSLFRYFFTDTILEGCSSAPILGDKGEVPSLKP